MKKRILCIAIFLCVCASICTYFAFFYKSADAKNADDLIMAIGEVSLYSGGKINKAEQAVLQLSEWERKQLDYEHILVESHNEYERLYEEANSEKNHADALAIMEKIESLGAITLESDEEIKRIRRLYNEQDTRIKDMVENYDILLEAEEQISILKIERAIELIDSLGPVTIESGPQIYEAENAYNALKSTDKKKISNVTKLEDARTAFDILWNEKEAAELEEANKEKEKKAKEALAKLNSEYDKVQDVTWYKPTSYPQYINTRSFLLPYLSQTDYGMSLRLKINYTGNNWVFFEKIIVVVDDERYTREFDYFEVTRDNGSGDVWEYVDFSPSLSDIDMLNAIANSSETIVRFEGDSKHFDLTISSKDKQGIKNVLTAYELN